MITRDIQLRVRYYETDCMGIVHHSNYIRFYEVARTEMLREFGTTYQEMEQVGVMLPVLDVQAHYISPAYDDDLLTIRVTLAEMPKVKMRFDFEIYRENGDRINTGTVTLAFMNSVTRRACRAPKYFLDLLKPYFPEA
jgi:acyl-CoA thioester hydrolase